jgi:hypothetical protein
MNKQLHVISIPPSFGGSETAADSVTGEISSYIERSTFHKTFFSCGYFPSIMTREISALDFMRDSSHG